jgi:predicted N-acetyltransferase YhbS
MSLRIRAYDHARDFDMVGRFLIDEFNPGNRLRNWTQPRWEYMHYHPLINDQPRERIGVLEDDGRVVGAAHLEHGPAVTYIQYREGYEGALPLLVDHLEANFGGMSRSLQRNMLGVYVNDFDDHLIREVAGRGFERQDRFYEHYSRFPNDRGIPEARLPAGFRLQSLAEENDLDKINRVLWRGFNHEGPVPDDEIPGRIQLQSAPGFRKDLNVVVVAPDGSYVAYAGMWFVPENKLGYVEPVATDPDFRLMGLGRAAVLEVVRRVTDLGAQSVWVGTDLDFYMALGFERQFRRSIWIKWLD